ncbi:putative bifunctional diguanylate cyclase/phosphodiesterase [Antrihabitans stalactiti]|uniref:EAL domain-containing protein n=1 Tax=Antrihabitans stalactiti TaxID=2584121 RepID=A0A848KKC1_9NOCA|nr:EAL domain-containing protein [Antrihabitans stalactiti]NMN98551.1 EAL domain-containing protein [Antrihabitans stalactiti]
MREYGAQIWNTVARVTTEGLIIATVDGTIIEFNAIAERIFRQDRANVVGKTMLDVLVPAGLRGAHRAIIARLRAADAPGAVVRFRTLIQRGDGTTAPIEAGISSTRVPRGANGGPELIVAFIRDPDRRGPGAPRKPFIPLTAEQPPEDFGDRIAEVLEWAPVIIFTVGLDGIIRMSTGGGLARIGVRTGELVGRSIFSLRPERDDLTANYQRALAGERFRSRVVLEERDWETQYQPLYDEVGELRGTIAISMDVTAQVVSERALRLLAETDTVTGLASRSHTEDLIAEVLATGRSLVLMLVDLDDFKDINDSHGHTVGDKVLHRVGMLLQATVPAGSILGRLGGDELVVGIPDSGLEDAEPIARRILDAISHPMHIDLELVDEALNLEVAVTASVGIAMAPADGDTISSLLTRADSAMYAAKRSGRSAHRFYRADADRASRRLAVSTRLRNAIKAGELSVEYQPVHDLTDSTIVGFEALARWNDDTLGSVSPDEFIALAERSPLIDEIFELVLHQSLATAAVWNSTHDSSSLVGISVNIAARQLRDTSLPGRIVGAADAVGLPPSCVTLELTETALMDEGPRTLRVLSALRDAGIRVWMDDYGVGYSNMARLGDLSAAGILDGVKIDRTFVADLPTARAETLLRMFFTMTESLGVTAVAEGIENDEQLQVLRRLGYRYGQGWHFAKSMPATAAVQLVLDD